MKVVVNGTVVDVGNGEVLCDLPHDAVTTATGSRVNIVCQLRKDRASGRFYVYKGLSCYEYDRKNVCVELLPKERAAALAENFLDYEKYASFFGDPEGELAEAKRKAADAEERAASSARDKDYWYKKWADANEKLEGRQSRVDELEGEVANLKEKLASA